MALDADVLVRPARPADSGCVARLMYLAGQGHLDLSIYDLMIDGPPGPTPERLAQMGRMLTTRHLSWFHYSHYDLAEVGGLVASSLCSFNKKQGKGRSLAAAFREAGWTDPDLVAMSTRLEPVFRVQPAVPREAWVVENVATFREFRRNGLAGLLLAGAIEKGRKRGYRQFQIGCVMGNTNALSVYESLGFAVTEELTDPCFEEMFGSPGMWRLTMRI